MATKSPKIAKRKNGTTPSPRAKKRRSVVLNFINLNAKYTLGEKFKKDFMKVLEKDHSPFPHWQLRNIVDNSSNIVEVIEEELQNFGEWKRKENDLYSLYQTVDFKALSASQYPALYSFRRSFCEEVRKWLEGITGIELTDIDCNGSCYARADSLLPHNDLIDTRRFAFVYYLTGADWDCKVDGGASWHRVAEIISDSPRLSINGWFHSKRRLNAKMPEVEQIPKFVPSKKRKLSNVLNGEYLTKKSKNSVQKTFADNSELNLNDFLLPEVHRNVFEELSTSEASFEIVGPPNKRHIARLNSSEVGNLENVASLTKAMKSTTLVKLMSDLTGVNLNGAKSSLKVSRVDKGSYWVLGDEDATASSADGYCLDVHIFVGFGEWNEEAGGELIYIAEDEEEELLRVTPSENSAAVVFREPGVMYFLKLVNNFATFPYFLFTLTYYDVNVVDS
ncbi:unnamed protein product [Caenorhabditis auriculariae]|uniref:Prolyl 4-hydroxylase alpha subunit domain-containing protein n=1 Tax=Caenorhabditis auriculariae TaxID=2777116 RepID=A0A8S1HGH2_9PELO|nr:unnamed protein product [Caenorhabditis auriculariae]